jgi:thiamine-phosphate pyrophosphorylase
MSSVIKGLYAITPDLADTAALLGKVEAALSGGARLVQYRNKVADPGLRLEQARGLAALCRRHGVPLIINDHLDLALAVDAEGLHIGGEDGSVADARRAIGPDRILGVSCYRKIENALDAAQHGATYVAFGGFFPSSVKRGSGGAPLSILGEAKRRPALPVVAIGGITVDNAPPLIAAGADSVSVITALFSAPDVKAAAQRFAALFERRLP